MQRQAEQKELIADRDDWQPFNDKVTAVRLMGEAMEQDAPTA